ncbi:MAG: Rne/Rng family ribonuclease [Ignavibacteriales bacterium]|nr:Rne/Rng family ribonuclease [Ignavibacteriales bacterium]
MIKDIIINSSSALTRIAITEDNNLVDYFVDDPSRRRTVGDIYLGRVVRILPGIRAVFINIGQKYDAFLHFSDIDNKTENISKLIDDDKEVGEFDEQFEENGKEKIYRDEKSRLPNLKKGQEILIQIIKEPQKNKGVRVSTTISLPGRFCVLIPSEHRIGISRKISDIRERKRLRSIARSILPENCGLILRTVAQDQTKESIQGDLKYLINLWKEIESEARKQKPPVVLYEDLSTTISVIRDHLSKDIAKVYIDSKKLYKEIKNYVYLVQPDISNKVEYFNSKEPIFDAFRIDEQVKTLLGRKVFIKSGGHIVIEQTEAMTVIDVNSGKFTGKKDQEQNSLKTDLEAAREIVRQLRLRDIGGMIVVDFIDLRDMRNRKKVEDELKKEFKKDRAKIVMLPMTDFGLIQITRERIRENILQSMHEICTFCNGTGLLLKKSNIIHDIDKWLKNYKMERNHKSLILNVHPSIGRELKKGTISTFTKLKLKYFVIIKLIEDPNISPHSFQFISAKSGKDITKEIK